KAMVTPPTIRVINTVQTDFTAYYTLQSAFPGVRNNFGINPTVPFKQTKDDSFASRTTTSFTANTLWSKVRLINFYLPSKLSVFFTFFSQTHAKFDKNSVDRTDRNPGQSGGIRSEKIERKIADNLPKILLCDSGTLVVPVFINHFRSLAPVKRCLTS